MVSCWDNACSETLFGSLKVERLHGMRLRPAAVPRTRSSTGWSRHHKQMIVLVLSAMRHLAELLPGEGAAVDYDRLGDEGNPGGSFITGELGRVSSHSPRRPDRCDGAWEWRVWEMMQTWADLLGATATWFHHSRVLYRTVFSSLLGAAYLRGCHS
jgi:deoxyribodipyrimidine photolyase-like uncharacterized protein